MDLATYHWQTVRVYKKMLNSQVRHRENSMNKQASAQEKLHHNLLKSKVGHESYKKIIRNWKLKKLKEVLDYPATNDELRRMRNNLIHAEITRRRNERTRPGITQKRGHVKATPAPRHERSGDRPEGQS